MLFVINSLSVGIYLLARTARRPDLLYGDRAGVGCGQFDTLAVDEGAIFTQDAGGAASGQLPGAAGTRGAAAPVLGAAFAQRRRFRGAS